MIIMQQCPFCMNMHTVEVEEKSFNEWLSGELIQNAMPNMSVTEREQLISGICPKCQDSIFGAE